MAWMVITNEGPVQLATPKGGMHSERWQCAGMNLQVKIILKGSTGAA
jgi:hypothetical protein